MAITVAMGLTFHWRLAATICALLRASGRTIPLAGGPMSLESRLESLKMRHASLESRIAEEDQRPRPDSDTLLRLKLEKLRLKEEMERLRNASGNH
jgi:hypothetical protein